MSNTLLVIEKIIATFVLIGIGWLARRKGKVDASTTRLVSSFTTDIALPALVLSTMLDKVDRHSIAESWPAMVLAIVVLLMGQLIGWMCWRIFCRREQAGTFIFVVAVANWIYLPLPIVQALYGDAGVRTLLLCNAGVQVLLWTLGVATISGGKLDRQGVLALLRNPGFICTVGGLILALFGTGPWLAQVGGYRGMFIHAMLEAIKMIGILTIPLSLLGTGAQLAGISAGNGRSHRPLFGVILLRMIVVPMAMLVVIFIVAHTGLAVGRVPLSISALIAMMPVAVSCSIFAQRFGGDTALAAQSILYTSLTAMATVPAMFHLFNVLMGW